MSSKNTDAVWAAARPLLIAALDHIETHVMDDLNIAYSQDAMYVTAKFPQNLAYARERLFPVFTGAGWGFKEETGRRPRLIFIVPQNLARTNLRVVR